MNPQLKAYIDASKKNSRVLAPLERYLMLRDGDQSRRTDVLHPSEIVGDDWCHRASYFHLKGEPVIKTRKTSLSLETVFAEGHAIHHRWQTWFKEMGVLYGTWKCSCDDIKWGLSSDLDTIFTCGCTKFKYREVPFDYAPLRIQGKADGWIIGLGAPMMLEIKSIGAGTLRFECPELLIQNNNDFDKTWSAITSPFMKHIMQVQIYMKLAELMGYENYPQEAVIVYEAKPNQKSKEFVIPKSDFGISHILENAAMIVKAVEEGIAPGCNISANGCSKCKGYSND
jgi:hypothetical protein